MKISGLATMLQNRRHRAEIYSTAEYWNTKAMELKGQAVSMWANNTLNSLYHAETIEILDATFPDIRGRRILDIGCGTGRLSRTLAERGGEVTGIDFDARAIDLALCASPSGNPSFRVQSVLDLDENAYYDIVVSWGCLSMAAKNPSDLLRILQGVRAALKPSGFALFLEPIHAGFLHRVLNLSLAEFCHALVPMGFEVISVRQLHFWPMRLALAYIPWPSWLTTSAYYIGQWCMKFPGMRGWGDYKAVYCRPVQIK